MRKKVRRIRRPLPKKALFCPVCGSEDIAPYAGFVSASYKCKKCGFVGNFFLEKTKRQKEGKL